MEGSDDRQHALSKREREGATSTMQVCVRTGYIQLLMQKQRKSLPDIPYNARASSVLPDTAFPFRLFGANMTSLGGRTLPPAGKGNVVPIEGGDHQLAE